MMTPCGVKFMNCPNCHTLCGDQDYFCYACGAALQQSPKPRKGSRWIPALILILMSAAGLILFFASAGSEAPAYAAASTDSGWFYVDKGVLYFNESLYTGGSELVVPSEINGTPVHALSKNCFAGCESLETVFLPDSLTSIGDGAFYDCTSLRGIYIPSSVTSIGKEAFYGCTALEAICLDNRIEAIGQDAFDCCSRLNYIFFLGTHNEWTNLYGEFINPYVGVFCEDGSFCQDGNVYN